MCMLCESASHDSLGSGYPNHSITEWMGTYNGSTVTTAQISTLRAGYDNNGTWTNSPGYALSDDIAALRMYENKWQAGMPGITSVSGKLNITYSFDATTTNQLNYNSEIAAQGRTQMTSQQETAARAIMAHMQEFLNVTFVDTHNNTAAMKFWTGDLNTYGSQWGTIGVAYFPNNSGSDITMDNVAERATDYAIGSFNYAVMAHEVGHAMGLSHPGNSGPNPAYSMDGTVMSYNGGTYATEGLVNGVYQNSAPRGYQILDIAALQSIYGANTGYNATNTTYVFDGSMYKKTIWDGGGVDTYTVAASFTGDVTIDLRSGVENRTSFGQTDVWTAYNANIENAITRNANDTIYGNNLANRLTAAGGNDALWGYGGNDVILGGLGGDTVDGGADNDAIYGDDASAGSGGADSLTGGTGNDSLYGYWGNDSIYGGDGADRIDAGLGDDLIYGGIGNDSIYSTQGADTIHGEDGDDLLHGDLASDTLGGADSLNGGAGIDLIYGFAANDTVRAFSI